MASSCVFQLLLLGILLAASLAEAHRTLAQSYRGGKPRHPPQCVDVKLNKKYPHWSVTCFTAGCTKGKCNKYDGCDILPNYDANGSKCYTKDNKPGKCYDGKCVPKKDDCEGAEQGKPCDLYSWKDGVCDYGKCKKKEDYCPSPRKCKPGCGRDTSRFAAVPTTSYYCYPRYGKEVYTCCLEVTPVPECETKSNGEGCKLDDYSYGVCYYKKCIPKKDDCALPAICKKGCGQSGTLRSSSSTSLPPPCYPRLDGDYTCCNEKIH